MDETRPEKKAGISMRHSFLLIQALVFALAACDECETHSDCNPGQMCVGGECQAGSTSSDLDIDSDADSDSDSDSDSDTDFESPYSYVLSAFIGESVAFGAHASAMAVVEGGEVTFSHGFGTTDPDGGDPVDPMTIFRIASLTKMLTAAGTLRLVEDGTVDLDAPAIDSIPYLAFDLDPTWAYDMTGRHLLTHSSGMWDYLQLDDIPASQLGDDGLAGFTATGFPSTMYLMAPSGAFWNYSNPNYSLAGLVSEEMSGAYYADYLDEEVFTPLDMSRTFLRPEDVVAAGNFAYGETTYWSAYFPDPIDPFEYDNGWARPAGYAFSTVLDLAKWIAFLRDGDPAVLSDDLREEMMSPQIDTHMLLDMMSYGFGLIVTDGMWVGDDFYDLRVIEHDGAVPGFSSQFFYVPDLDLALITLAAADGAYYYETWATALEVLGDLPTPSSQPDFSMDPDTYYDSYAGEYEDPYNTGGVIVTRSGDGSDLLIEMPDLDALETSYSGVLAPLYRDNFLMTIEGADLQITFIFEDGSPDAATYLRNRSFVGARVPDGTLATKGSPAFAGDERIRSFIDRVTSLPPRPLTSGERAARARATSERR